MIAGGRENVGARLLGEVSKLVQTYADSTDSGSRTFGHALSKRSQSQRLLLAIYSPSVRFSEKVFKLSGC